MAIYLTHTAREGMREIFEYNAKYTVEFAITFAEKVNRFLFDRLSEHPRSGTLYNPEKDIFRLVYRYRRRSVNIYYIAKDDDIYVIYVLDGRVKLNAILETSNAEIPPLS